MRWLIPAAIALALLGATAAPASRATALPCLTGELRPTVSFHRVGKTLSIDVRVRNIGSQCLFQTVGAAVQGGETRVLVWRKKGRAVAIPHGRTVRLHVTWANWCLVGPSRIILLIKGKGGWGQFGMPYFPGPSCTSKKDKSRVTVGSPALVPRKT